MHEVTLDLETQKAFHEVGNDAGKLLVSLVGIHSTKHELLSFMEDELENLWSILEDADLVIGYNIKHFDYNVLKPYYNGEIHKLPTLDIMEEITNYLGHRAKLDDVAKHTLGKQKSGHGLQAIEFFKNGEIDKLKQYCLDDVKITREIYEFGCQHGKIMAPSSGQIKEIPVSWAKLQPKPAANLTLPF